MAKLKTRRPYGNLWRMYAAIVETPGDADQITVGDVDRPEPQAGEVLIRTVASGVNRADLLQRKGLYSPAPGVSETMGLEASGVIEAVGSDVNGWEPGDEVVALLSGGGYAEYFVAPAGQVLPPPTGMDLITAAGMVEVAATVVSNMDAVGLKSEETLLVHGGSGGIGTFAIQYAKALGCTVATTAGTKKKLKHCKEHGADIALDYHDDWVQGLKDATDGRGADVILDIMGAKYLEMNVKALARHGRIVIIGMQGGVKGTLNIGALLTRMGTITATALRSRSVEEKSEICRRVAGVVWPMVADGRVRPAPETHIPFAEVQRAHELLESGDNVGKIVLVHGDN